MIKQTPFHVHLLLFNSHQHKKVGWLCFTSYRQRCHLEMAPHLLSLVKDVKLGFYTVPTGKRTPGCPVAVHYTPAPHIKRKTLVAILDSLIVTDLRLRECEAGSFPPPDVASSVLSASAS